ncbi:hypothetical protein LEADMM068B1_03015 [Leclercia adecarboxylata]
MPVNDPALKISYLEVLGYLYYLPNDSAVAVYWDGFERWIQWHQVCERAIPYQFFYCRFRRAIEKCHYYLSVQII